MHACAETLVHTVARSVVESCGKKLTVEAQIAGTGKRPLEAWQAVADVLGIEKSGQELLDMSEPLLLDLWQDCKPMPGASRLVHHLRQSGIPIGCATR
jgi:riboflavin kinase / FMN hydrolase